MTTRITTSNIETTTLAQLGGPKITNIQVTDSNYTVLDDTAIDVAGGYVLVTGTGFESGCQVVINNTPATSVSYISSTQVRAQLPATAAGTYIVYLVNPTGGVAIRVNGITFSATPAWSTGSTLPAGVDGTSISIQLAAAGASTYTLAAGSTLPGTLTLSSGGLIAGVVSGLTGETTYNFTVVATDAELQDSPRTFSITITAGDSYFNSTTLLLSGNANTFVKDSSTNNFPVTVVGDTKPNNFNPYLTGWSNYFDGSGDYLSVPYNATTNILSGDFAVECWINHTATQYDVIVSSWGQSGINSTDGWIIRTGDNNELAVDWAAFSTNGAFITTANNVIQTGKWHHVAFTRSGNTFNIWVDGVSVGTGTNSGTNTSQYQIDIGFYGNGSLGGSPQSYFNGYISNLRIVKGSAVYTASFVVPTAPLTAIAGTGLLTCQSNRFVDNSTNNFAITRNGDVKIQSFSPFVEPLSTNGSAYFDGTGDYLTVAGNAAFQFGTGDFTIEMWVYPQNTSGTGLVEHRSAPSNIYLWYLTSTNLYPEFFTGVSYTGNISVPVNRWSHLAVSRASGTLRQFVNGALAYSGSGINTALDSTGTIRLMASNDSAQYSGYTSNLRIVKGTALYTAAFTPPTAPLTAVADTSLLTLQNNTPQTNNQFLDSSSNNLLVTRAGNTTQGTFSPYSPSGWSNYFDGTGDYLSFVPTATNSIGTGDFTIEAWVYPTSTLSGWNDIIVLRPGSFGLLFNSGVLTAYGLALNGSTLASTYTAVLNTWQHVAITRSAGTLRIFANGVQVGLSTGSVANIVFDGTTISYISSWSGASEFFPGYISNVRVVKGTAVYTMAFTPPTQPLTAIPGTVLLTCADNRFVDDSPTNSAITRNGDTRVTNFSPFRAVTQTPTTYSAYFDGTGDYLSLANNVALQFTADFTIEMWLYPTALSGVKGLFGQRATESNYSPIILEFNGAALTFQVSTSGSSWAVNLASPSLTANTWTHIALVRNSSTVTLYVNGVSAGTGTASGALMTPVAPTYLGMDSGSPSGAGYFPGYISNVRIVKGTAVYTSNFTPPTQPLTAITNTSLLTCQSATFVDNSTNRFAITATGNSQPTAVNPFGSTFANSTGYTAAEYSGSMYFDGTGDHLLVPTSTLLSLASNNFTIELWMYTTTKLNTTPVVISNGNFGSNKWQLNDRHSGTPTKLTFNLYNASTSNGWLTSASVITDGVWYHVAIVRNGNTFTMYVNGVAEATATYTGSVDNGTTQPIYVAQDAGQAGTNYNGYISNIRIIKGAAAYTSNFVPPLTPMLPVQNTIMLLNGTAAAITDATTRNDLETVGDARISTAVSKFGGSSVFFDGSGDYLSIADNPLIELGSANFTVEGWFNWTANSGNWSLFYKASSYELKSDSNRWVWQVNTSSNVFVTNWTPTLSTWYHIALVRDGATTTLYVNGTNYTSGASVAANDNTNPLLIGANPGTAVFNGYMQDFRITRGTARYTANFTPPTTQHQVK